MTGDPITAILDQLAAHAEQIARLDAREAASSAQAGRRIADLARLASTLDRDIAALAAQVGRGSSDDADVHSPAPSRRWWKLSGEDRDQAIGALRAWVDEVYRPGYGQLSASLGPCWDQHVLCLYALDILAELWSVLYLPGQRSPAVLSAQAEYQARILPAVADQMTAETSRCRHARERLTTPGREIRSTVNPARTTAMSPEAGQARQAQAGS